MKRSCITLFVIIFISACHKPAIRKNEINKIEIATAGGIRHYPVFGIIIDSTLSYRYYGSYYSKPQGYYEGKVTQAFWDTLNIKLKQINFKEIETSKYFGMDEEVIDAVFYWDRQRRHVFKPLFDDGNNEEKVFRWILNSYKTIQLSKSIDSAKFAATFQYILPEPPKPKVDQVKFPPPPKHRKK